MGGEIMKRKFLAVVFGILAATLLVGIFAGCSSGGARTNAGVTLNKKYIDEECLTAKENEQTYYVFTSAEEGYYHYYYFSGGTFSYCSAYTVYFRYQIVGGMLFCFYDSVEYDPAHDSDNVKTYWASEFTVCCGDFLVKNIEIGGGASAHYYFSEDYLGEIPNFGK